MVITNYKYVSKYGYQYTQCSCFIYLSISDLLTSDLSSAVGIKLYLQICTEFWMLGNLNKRSQLWWNMENFQAHSSVNSCLILALNWMVCMYMVILKLLFSTLFFIHSPLWHWRTIIIFNQNVKYFIFSRWAQLFSVTTTKLILKAYRSNQHQLLFIFTLKHWVLKRINS